MVRLFLSEHKPSLPGRGAPTVYALGPVPRQNTDYESVLLPTIDTYLLQTNSLCSWSIYFTVLRFWLARCRGTCETV